MVGLDVVHDDLLVAELGAGHQLLERGEQRRVAAPVDRERLPGGRALRGVEVRRDVAAPERVDRLLRVADQHHRRVAGERPVEHLPLHRVGVLELVDQHDLPALPHPRPRRGVVVDQRLGELAEQVVVGEDAEPPLAAVHLGAHGVGERHPASGRGGAVLGGRLEVGLGVADRVARDRHRLLVVEDRVVLAVRERAEVEVVDHLADQVVEVLDQSGPGVGVAGDAERAEHHRAELVRGRDRRRVEPRQRLEHPPVPHPALLGVAVEQQPDQVGVAHLAGEGGVVAESALGLHQLGPDPLAQLLAGRPAERHHQHLLQPGLTLGDVAGDQRADGPGLAGAGARLEQRGAGGQRAADVEGVHLCCLHSGPTRSAPVSSGSQIRQAYAGSPSSRSRSTGAASP